MKKVLIILRGIPGCGKSTFAEVIGEFICTADDYFLVNGEYMWDPKRLGDAHKACRDKVLWGMESNMAKIIVANTSTTVKEMKPYYEMAEKFGYEVFSVIVENRHGGVNTHNVPEEALDKMKTRFNIKL